MMFTPDYSTATGLLKHLNLRELQELLDSDEKLDNMVNDLVQVKQIEGERQLLLASNKSLAEFNLSLKPELEENRQQLILQYEEASALKSKLESCRSQLSQMKCSTDCDTILNILRATTAEAEENSEKLFESLLSKESTVDKFLEDYMKERARVHVLRTKSDKMAALLLEREGATPPQKPRRQKKAPQPPMGQNSPLPYPIFSNDLFPSALPLRKSEPLQPTRIAPQPPVQIPRRQSNPVQPVAANFPYLKNVPTPPSPYPQYLKLPM